MEKPSAENALDGIVAAVREYLAAEDSYTAVAASLSAGANLDRWQRALDAALARARGARAALETLLATAPGGEQ